MGLFRRRPRSSGGEPVSDSKAARTHLQQFASTRRGVEAYVEPPTNVTAPTIVLVAWDGEWTRRALRTRDEAFKLGNSLGVPTYDVQATGYPSRMREWTSRQRKR